MRENFYSGHKKKESERGYARAWVLAWSNTLQKKKKKKKKNNNNNKFERAHHKPICERMRAVAGPCFCAKSSTSRTAWTRRLRRQRISANDDGLRPTVQNAHRASRAHLHSSRWAFHCTSCRVASARSFQKFWSAARACGARTVASAVRANFAAAQTARVATVVRPPPVATSDDTFYTWKKRK